MPPTSSSPPEPARSDASAEDGFSSTVCRRCHAPEACSEARTGPCISRTNASARSQPRRGRGSRSRIASHLPAGAGSSAGGCGGSGGASARGSETASASLGGPQPKAFSEETRTRYVPPPSRPSRVALPPPVASCCAHVPSSTEPAAASPSLSSTVHSTRSRLSGSPPPSAAAHVSLADEQVRSPAAGRAEWRGRLVAPSATARGAENADQPASFFACRRTSSSPPALACAASQTSSNASPAAPASRAPKEPPSPAISGSSCQALPLAPEADFPCAPLLAPGARAERR